MYESSCTLCNPEEGRKKKKEGAKDLGDKQGVYVGESTRSIKHWLSNHQELKSPPKFRIEVVGSFQDAMNLQIAEAVRIDLRGEQFLNSKSEYSRCRIPRLVIDQEDWRVFKKKEKDDLEPKQVERNVELNINGEEEDVLEEETEFEMVETRNKAMNKRKVDEGDQPSKKKRKYDTIVNWGDMGEGEETVKVKRQ